MAQALLNNLKNNITQENSFSLNDKSIPSDAKSFEKIFDSKTISVSNTKKTANANETVVSTTPSTSTNSNVNANTNTNTLSNVSEAETTKDVKTLGDIKSTSTTDNETLSEAISETIDEAEAESVVDMVTMSGICESGNGIIDNSETEENTESISEENTETTDNTSDTTNTNITNEDPTMYTNAEPLENPMAVMLLQSQITMNKLNVVNGNGNQVIETTSETSVNLKENSANSEFSLKESKLVSLFSREDVNTNQNDTQNSVKNTALSTKIVKDLNIESVKAGDTKGNTSSNDFMKNGTPQEQAVKIMIQSEQEFVNIEVEAQTAGIADSISQTTGTQTANVSKPVITNISSEKIIEQITKQMETMHKGSKVNIILNPASLGKIQLQMVNSKEGLTAQFTVTTQEARDILMKGLDGLKDSLLAQGVNVNGVSVELEESAETEYKQDYTEQEGSGDGYKRQGTKHQKEEEKPFEQMMSDIENNDKV